MHCPVCGTHNPHQARFCMGCGNLLTPGIVCSLCHTLLPPQARYCYHCGAFVGEPGMTAAGVAAKPAGVTAQAPPVPAAHPAQQGAPPAGPVTPPPPVAAQATPQTAPTRAADRFQLPEPRSLESMLPLLERYLSRNLYEPLERRPKERHLGAVRDHLTALLATAKTYLPLPVVMAPQPAGEPRGGMYRGVFLFGDVSGFTPLSESLKRQEGGAERVAEIINNLFSELVRELFDHGGTLLKFGGDALLGLFPAESDEEMAAGAMQAAQASLAMLRVMEQEKYAAIEAGGETRALKIKCGISAGPYFAAHIGTPPSNIDYNGMMAYVTTGHTVNLAEQAEGHAHPGEVAMTRPVAALLSDRVETGPVTKEPDEDFVQLRAAPPAEVGTLARPDIPEPPEGPLDAQITYLVDRLNLLMPYLSDELVDRVKNNPGDARIVPEYRPVTVMFANYKGISNLIEKLGESDPNIITTRLNDYFGHMAHIVEKYEGTLARMDQYAVGDRLVIFFGAPKAHENDPDLALYTALDMQNAVRQNFSALRTSSGVFRFEQRIGINTGLLFAGNAGAPNLRQEYTLMGDDINMAARLMSYAPWGKIYISDKSESELKNKEHFDFGDRFELKVKGKKILIPTYELLGRRGKPTSHLILADEPPLTGRDEALEQLQECGHSLLANQRGQIVVLTGNSGLGKTRLKRELRAWVCQRDDADNLVWLEGQALSFSEQMNYWLAAQILRSALNLAPDATEDDVLFALWEQGEQLLDEDAMDAIPFLAHIMGLELGEEWAWVKELAPKVRQKQTFWAAGEFLTGLARQHPMVIALEDLHWADEASLSLIESLLKVTDRAPVMFLMLFRARRDKGCWQLRNTAATSFPHRFQELNLKPLLMGESKTLLHQLVPGAEFEPATLQNLLEKAAGNPYYLEEVIRSMKEAGAVVPDAAHPGQWLIVPERAAQIEIPNTLQAAIVARIDRLTEDGRQALQMASVIGRQFQSAVLRNLTQAEAEIDTWLAQLERGGLIRPESHTDVDYAFPDALVQEVAYNSLLVNSRKAFHRKIGETLEQLLGERVEQNCDLLAYHFSRGDDDARAIKYLKMAAQKSRSEYANATAIQHYRDLLKIMERVDDKAGQASALYQMGVLAYEIGDYQQARPWLERATQLYREIDDMANVGWSVMYAGMVALKQANYDEALKLHAQALSIAESRGDMFQAGIHITNAARVSMRMGTYQQAIQLFNQSLEAKKKSNDLNGQGFAHYFIGLIRVMQGNDQAAEAAFEACLEAWQQVENNDRVISYARYGQGRLALLRGHSAEARDYFQTALDLSNKLVLKAEIIENLSFLGQAQLGEGHLDAALDVSSQAITLLAAQKDVEEAQQIYYNHYEVLRALDAPEARECLEEAHAEMMSQAERIAEEEKRRIFLENVPVNQKIRAAMNNERE